jgi:hypothetical protein
MTKDSKIISYTSRNDACYWYRNKHPLEALKRQGWQTSNLNMGEFMDLRNVDCVQFSRVYTTKFDEFAFMLKDMGISLWYDVDDATDLVKPFNPFCVANRQHMSSLYFMLNEADFITTTNETLKEHLSHKTPKPIHVVPNFIHPPEWKERPRKNTQLRVGFAGSPSHIKEVNMILPVVAQLQKRYNFKFVMAGMGGGGSAQAFRDEEKAKFPDIWETWSYTQEVEKFAELMKEIDCEWHNPIRWEIYPRIMAKLDLDIGLCPIIDDDFNRCKTPIKLYEYSMVGTCALASNVKPFAGEALAVTENTHEGWFEALDALLMHQELRDKTLFEQRNIVMRDKVIDNNVGMIEDVLAQYGKPR